MTNQYIIDNNIDNLNNHIKSIVKNIKNFFNNDDEVKLYSMVIYEAIFNAIEHGNLHIIYEQKKKWIKEGVYRDNLFALMKEDYAVNSKIHFTSTLENNTLITIIEDEGDGFNPDKQFNLQTKDDLVRENGRGLILIKSYFDSVTYNEKGNKITLIKKAT